MVGLVLEMNALGVELQEEAVRVFEAGVTKRDALAQLSRAIASTGAIADGEKLVQAVMERESVMSTGIGGGVAIPHVRLEGVRRPAVGVGVSSAGVDFDTLDNEPVNVIVLFAMPPGSQKEYLGLLAQVMMVMKEPGFTDKLAAAQTPAEVVELFQPES